MNPVVWLFDMNWTIIFPIFAHLVLFYSSVCSFSPFHTGICIRSAWSIAYTASHIGLSHTYVVSAPPDFIWCWGVRINGLLRKYLSEINAFFYI